MTDHNGQVDNQEPVDQVVEPGSSVVTQQPVTGGSYGQARPISDLVDQDESGIAVPKGTGQPFTGQPTPAAPSSDFRMPNSAPVPVPPNPVLEKAPEDAADTDSDASDGQSDS